MDWADLKARWTILMTHAIMDVMSIRSLVLLSPKREAAKTSITTKLKNLRCDLTQIWSRVARHRVGRSNYKYLPQCSELIAMPGVFTRTVDVTVALREWDDCIDIKSSEKALIEKIHPWCLPDMVFNSFVTCFQISMSARNPCVREKVTVLIYRVHTPVCARWDLPDQIAQVSACHCPCLHRGDSFRQVSR